MFISYRLELTLVPVKLCSVVSRCLQLKSRGTSIPLLDVETLFTTSIVPPAQSIRIAVPLTRSMFDPVKKLG